MNILFKKRSHDWKAWIEGETGKWESGHTMTDVIGKLIVSHQLEFNIIVKSKLSFS